MRGRNPLYGETPVLTHRPRRPRIEVTFVGEQSDKLEKPLQSGWQVTLDGEHQGELQHRFRAADLEARKISNRLGRIGYTITTLAGNQFTRR